MTALFIAAFAALALAGAPIFALMGALALRLFHEAGIDSSAVIIELARLASLPSLIAIPLFTFAGYVLAESGAPKRLVALAEALFGWIPGGVAVAGLCATALFTAFTGASGVTIIALGGLIFPLLRRQGYPENFSLGLISTTGSLGLLFPPSLPIILYALVGKISVDKLFAAAAVPGLLLLGALCVYAVVVARREGVRPVAFSWSGVRRAAREQLWEIPLPFLVIGGIYGGLFTASEAAAVMAFYVVAVESLVYKDVAWSRLPEVARRSMMLVGSILIVLGCALGLTGYMIDAEIPGLLFAFLHDRVSSPWVFLAMLNVFLLVVNMVEIFSAIVIVVPIIAPVAVQYGIDPVHLGALFLLNLEIGYMTPPLGLNLFLASRRFDKPLPILYRAVGPFWALLVATLLIVTYCPSLSLWLPGLLRLK
ncbi:MAG TPA: C4-dicarboxylate ABC transporter [Elusimicrobia bacterium]|nr:MAG: C4-dicarboxylate ABC transporter [Elusimicrobia bacterium GWA2_66_18]OGR70613.1 MAG: C4-dicarboxylate ABC transporter [Elusimicrobia bacterium GWC2_65_9]HAZ07618.1 C4-dicarboxylate ABC transporter [Elusimicrobiota bacterium]